MSPGFVLNPKPDMADRVSMNLYPLILQPILKEKVWGGRRLSGFGKDLPNGVNIGESWEFADLASTSASGGGGEAAISVIENGEFAGKTVRDAIAVWGEGMMGDVSLSGEGGFPLLVKYLDAREHLSVQVHPSVAYAGSHDGAHLKTESWYILDAEPGSVIYKGLREGLTEADLRRAIETETVPDVLRSMAAVVGECHTLESGTVHALGAGVLVAEVQTPSDTTFRVYDWAKEYGRMGRELHVEQAVECALFEEPSKAIKAGLDDERTLVARTSFYTMKVIRASDETVSFSDHAGGGPIVVMFVGGEGGAIVSRDGLFDKVGVEMGPTVLVPGGIVGDCALKAGVGTVAVVAGVVGGCDGA